MRIIIQVLLIILCMCFCSCASPNENTLNTQGNINEENDNTSNEETRLKEDTSIKENKMFALYDMNHGDAEKQFGGLPGCEVLTVEKAKKILDEYGYATTDWVDVWGNAYEGDNSRKQILYVVYMFYDGLESVYIAYIDGEEKYLDQIITEDEISNGCLRLRVNAWNENQRMYIPSTELASFEQWAKETDQYWFYYEEGETEEEVVWQDEVDYKIEASANIYRNYRDLLRNPDNYVGCKTSLLGTVQYVFDQETILFTSVSGDEYYIYVGLDTPNVIAGDYCYVYGEFCGTANYYTTNEYGVEYEHTVVAFYAPYIVTGYAENLPYDEREIALIYDTFDNGWDPPIIIHPDYIEDTENNKRYEYTIAFGSKEIYAGGEKIPVTIEYYDPDWNRTYTAEGSFRPYDRGLFFSGWCGPLFTSTYWGTQNEY